VWEALQVTVTAVIGELNIRLKRPIPGSSPRDHHHRRERRSKHSRPRPARHRRRLFPPLPIPSYPHSVTLHPPTFPSPRPRFAVCVAVSPGAVAHHVGLQVMHDSHAQVPDQPPAVPQAVCTSTCCIGWEGIACEGAARRRHHVRLCMRAAALRVSLGEWSDLGDGCGRAVVGMCVWVGDCWPFVSQLGSQRAGGFGAFINGLAATVGSS